MRIEKEELKQRKEPDTIETVIPGYGFNMIGSRERLKQLHSSRHTERLWFLLLIMIFIGFLSSLGALYQLENVSLLAQFLPDITNKTLYALVYGASVTGAIGIIMGEIWLSYYLLMLPPRKYIIPTSQVICFLSVLSLNIVGLIVSVLVLVGYPRIVAIVHPTERTVWRDWKGRVQSTK